MLLGSPDRIDPQNHPQVGIRTCGRILGSPLELCPRGVRLSGAGRRPIDHARSARHPSFAFLAKSGVPLAVVNERLGHSAIGVTAECCLQVYSDRDAEAASVLDTLCG